VLQKDVSLLSFSSFLGAKVKQKQGPKWGLRCACAKAKKLRCRLYQNKGPGQAKGFLPNTKNIIGITVDKVQGKKADLPTQEEVGLNFVFAS
jgi:hypothetical protein